MNTFLSYGIIFVILLVLELVYFKIADKCNIIDKPNERSSHSTIVLRGGGIIFPIAIIVRNHILNHWQDFTTIYKGTGAQSATLARVKLLFGNR